MYMNLILSRTPSVYMYTYHAYTRAQNAEIAANIQCCFFLYWLTKIKIKN